MIAAFNGLSLMWRAVSVLGVLVAVWAAVAVYNESQRMKGEARVVERSKEQGKANAKKADKAHERARAPGSADRLRADPRTCPDCGR